MTGGRLGGNGPGGGTGGLRFTGGGVRIGGGGGSPGGGGPSTTGGCAGKGSIPGRFTSSTTTGSLPWSKGHMSPLIQNPFSASKGLLEINVKSSGNTNYLWVTKQQIRVFLVLGKIIIYTCTRALFIPTNISNYQLIICLTYKMKKKI